MICLLYREEEQPVPWKMNLDAVNSLVLVDNTPILPTLNIFVSSVWVQVLVFLGEAKHFYF